MGQADGFAFVIHGDPSKGAAALGLGGGEHVRRCTFQSTVSVLAGFRRLVELNRSGF